MTSHLMAEFNSVDNLIRSIHGNVRVAYCDIIGMDMEVYKYCTHQPHINKTFLIVLS